VEKSTLHKIRKRDLESSGRTPPDNDYFLG
jgi:hypothetical protein